MSFMAGRMTGLRNAKKNCILHLSKDRNNGVSKMSVPDTPYMLAGKTASSA
jgi:hypothetical protein